VGRLNIVREFEVKKDEFVGVGEDNKLYFSSNPKSTDEKRNWVKLIQDEPEYFVSLTIHRDDIKQTYGEDELTNELEVEIDDLSDDQMRVLAKKMQEAYCETDFDSTLRSFFEDLRSV